MAAFCDAVKGFWRKYAEFNGTTTRREFWFPVLFIIGLNIVVNLIVNLLMMAGLGWAHWLWIVLYVALFLPVMAMTVRRFRDAGISPLWFVVPFVVFLVWGLLGGVSWMSLISMGLVPGGALAFSGLVTVFEIFVIVVACLPSKKGKRK